MFKRIHESGLWLILAMFAASIGFISLMWVRGSDFGVNVGFLVLGVLLSIATTLVAEVRERNLKTTDLARVYAETAHLVARCCFDSEAPWKEFGSVGLRRVP
jgi:hypothetical protein